MKSKIPSLTETPKTTQNPAHPEAFLPEESSFEISGMDDYGPSGRLSWAFGGCIKKHDQQRSNALSQAR